jgi:hypothetical protein
VHVQLPLLGLSTNEVLRHQERGREAVRLGLNAPCRPELVIATANVAAPAEDPPRMGFARSVEMPVTELVRDREVTPTWTPRCLDAIHPDAELIQQEKSRELDCSQLIRDAGEHAKIGCLLHVKANHFLSDRIDIDRRTLKLR